MFLSVDANLEGLVLLFGSFKGICQLAGYPVGGGEIAQQVFGYVDIERLGLI